MKLYFSPPSPYSRKVRVTALELGLELPLEQVNATAWDNNYGTINPINRVPALALDDGTVLIDSPLICEYLDVANGSKLLPQAGAARWDVLLLQALGDGLMDAAVPRRHEVLRPVEQQSPERLRLYRRSIEQTLDHLEARVDTMAGVNLGTIAITCALSYIDFRFAADDWADTRPRLAAWCQTMLARPSFGATAFG
jgi:glutathione S-transferase